MRVVTNNVVIQTEGYMFPLERGAVMRRTNVNYELVRQPVAVPRPQVDDFNSLVVTYDKIEYYS